MKGLFNPEPARHNVVAFILGSAASENIRVLLVKPRKAPAPIIHAFACGPTV